MKSRQNESKKLEYKFVFITPVWGVEYMRMFSDVCLPMMLTDGNLNKFRDRSDACFVIVCGGDDFRALKSSEAYRRLCDVVQVEIVLIDGMIDTGRTHSAMTKCYQLGMSIEGVVPGFTNFVFLTPDSFWSDGSFEYAERIMDSGKKALVTVGLRTNREAMIPILNSAIARTKGTAAPFNNREIAGLAIRHLHQLGRAHLWFSKAFLNSWPSNIYWKVDDELLISHNFHMHPLVVRCPKRRRNINIKSTIDGDYLIKVGLTGGNVHVVTDSDALLGIELSPRTRDWGGVELREPRLRSVQWFGLNYANRMHWKFFGQRVVIKARDLKKEDGVFFRHSDEIVKIVSRVHWVARLLYPFHLISILRLLLKVAIFVKAQCKTFFSGMTRFVKRILIRMFIGRSRRSWSTEKVD
ncbi:MAG: hypothetical protein RLN89_02930 [Parvibaculum sp.]